MLRQICRRGRFDAFIQDNAVGVATSDTPVSTALQNLSPVLLSPKQSPQPTLRLSPIFEAQYYAQAKPLSPIFYNLILAYVNNNPESTKTFRHFQQLPHPIDGNVLPPHAVVISYVEHKSRNYSVLSMHQGNASISFRRMDGFVSYGFIQEMRQLVLEGQMRTFIIISPHRPLAPADDNSNPYPKWPGFQCAMVYSEPVGIEQWIIIEEKHIIGHVPYYQRPSGTFGIRDGTLILIESLYRNRL